MKELKKELRKELKKEWTYAVAEGGLPPQSARLTDRAIFTTAYAFIPKGVMADIVTSFFAILAGYAALGASPSNDRIFRNLLALSDGC